MVSLGRSQIGAGGRKICQLGQRCSGMESVNWGGASLLCLWSQIGRVGASNDEVARLDKLPTRGNPRELGARLDLKCALFSRTRLVFQLVTDPRE